MTERFDRLRFMRKKVNLNRNFGAIAMFAMVPMTIVFLYVNWRIGLLFGAFSIFGFYRSRRFGTHKSDWK